MHADFEQQGVCPNSDTSISRLFLITHSSSKGSPALTQILKTSLGKHGMFSRSLQSSRDRPAWGEPWICLGAQHPWVV